MEKNIKKLKRYELLELLLEVSQENEFLKNRIQELENQIENQTITISEKGTIAEVTIKLNGILEDIENVTKKYTQSKKDITS